MVVLPVLPVLLLVRVRVRMGHVLLPRAQGIRHAGVRGDRRRRGGMGDGRLIPDAEEVDGRSVVAHVVPQRKRVLEGRAQALLALRRLRLRLALCLAREVRRRLHVDRRL